MTQPCLALTVLVVVAFAPPAAAQGTGHPACDTYLEMVAECIRTKMPASERAEKQQQLDHFREMLANPVVGGALAEKCGENIRIELQRDEYGCYASRAQSAGVRTACSLIAARELSAMLGRAYGPGMAGNSRCTYEPRPAAAGRQVIIEVAWTDGHAEMDAWRAGVRAVERELRKSTTAVAVESVTVPGLADDAFFVAAGLMPILAVRRGDVAVSIQAAAPREQLFAIARKALEQLR